MSKAPVLLLAFNRPNDVVRVLEQIRRHQPDRLLIACDGPRLGQTGDVVAVENTRNAIAGMLTWPCAIAYRYRETNLGCRAAVMDALEWAFSLEEKLIILEDDCVPSPDFFRFVEELLPKYANDPRVGSISGVNLSGCSPAGDSYYFSRFFHCWGWASWSRVWNERQKARLFDVCDFQYLKTIDMPTRERKFWNDISRQIMQGRLDSWAYEFNFLSLKHAWLNAIPSESVVDNIGYAASATHTTGWRPPWLVTGSIPFPLLHPELAFWPLADDVVSRRIFQRTSLLRRIYRKIRKTLKPVHSDE